MTEEQLKLAEAEATEQEGGEEILEEDLEGVDGGNIGSDTGTNLTTAISCTCGEENCDCLSCDSEAISG